MARLVALACIVAGLFACVAAGACALFMPQPGMAAVADAACSGVGLVTFFYGACGVR